MQSDDYLIDARSVRAFMAGMLFSGAFTLACAVLAFLAWSGLIGRPEDAPALVWMSLGGALILVGHLTIGYLFRGGFADRRS